MSRSSSKKQLLPSTTKLLRWMMLVACGSSMYYSIHIYSSMLVSDSTNTDGNANQNNGFTAPHQLPVPVMTTKHTNNNNENNNKSSSSSSTTTTTTTSTAPTTTRTSSSSNNIKSSSSTVVQQPKKQKKKTNKNKKTLALVYPTGLFGGVSSVFIERSTAVHFVLFFSPRYNFL